MPNLELELQYVGRAVQVITPNWQTRGVPYVRAGLVVEPWENPGEDPTRPNLNVLTLGRESNMPPGVYDERTLVGIPLFSKADHADPNVLKPPFYCLDPLEGIGVPPPVSPDAEGD